MKTKRLELDVDFIGGQGPLTIAEETALSNYLKGPKQAIKKPRIKDQLKKVKQHKTTA